MVMHEPSYRTLSGWRNFFSGFAACCVVCAMIAKLLKATKANSTHFKIHLFFMFLV